MLEAQLGEQVVEEEERRHQGKVLGEHVLESVDSVVTRGVEPLRLDGESVREVIVVSIVLQLHVVKYPEQHLEQVFPPVSFKLIFVPN